MGCLYNEILPFEYKIYAGLLDISLSGKSKEKLAAFLSQIENIGKGHLDEEQKKGLKESYGKISAAVVGEIRKSGNKKSKHILEEAEFIFVCSYLLIEKCSLSQKELAFIWGIKEKDFSRLDIHPARSHDAYTRLDSEDGKKTLVPEDYNSPGIRIAECINKKIQAVHTCGRFIGITNDLDVFANISSGDKKSYILTRQSDIEWDNTEDKVPGSISYGGGLFCYGK